MYKAWRLGILAILSFPVVSLGMTWMNSTSDILVLIGAVGLLSLVFVWILLIRITFF